MFFGYPDWTLALVLPAFALALYAQFKVRSTFQKYTQVRTARGRTGAEVAAELLTRRGVSDVKVEPVEGMLSDHYDPRKKVLRLSPEVYGSDSVAAVGVAAHECGHALQDKERYPALALRSAIVPVAGVITTAAIPLFFIGLIANMRPLMDLGILFFLGYVAFSLITLPVEFDASKRAALQLANLGLTTTQETGGVKKVLNAAALTYVAGALAALTQLLYFVLLYLGNRD